MKTSYLYWLLVCFVVGCGASTSEAAAKMQITTTSLPQGTAGVAYSQTLNATGPGSPKWSLLSGNLPSGLSLKASGTIAGSPSTVGSFTFMIEVTGSAGRSASANLTIVVATPVQVSSQVMPGGTTGLSYTAAAQGTGGTPPYNWSVLAGQLPPGITLASTTGIISGTPSTAGTYNFTIQMADSYGRAASGVFSIVVAAAVCSSCGTNPLIMTSTLPAGVINTAYTATLAATGGAPPYSWSVFSGQLPAGLTLASSGSIAGTPTTAGSYGFSITVTDSAGHQASQPYQLAVSNANGSLAVLTNELHLGYLGQAYDAVLTASGGVAPYSWNLTSGQLPAGLSINTTTGHISGTPTQGGQFSITASAKDAANATGSKSFNLEVFEQPTDQYGGLTNSPSPNGGTGYFRIEKSASGKWLFVTPAGNYFWLLSVWGVNAGANGAYQSAVTAKYGGTGTQFTAPAVERLKSWGFNALAEDASIYAVDINNPQKVPWIFYGLISEYAMEPSPQGNIKNLWAGASPNYTGYAGGSFPDVYDPSYQTFYAAEANPANTFPGGIANDPWVIGAATDDADNLFGFKGGPSCETNPHPHLGWATATMKFAQNSCTSGVCNGATYSNTQVYTKSAWITFLQSEYSSIAALNTAWGTSGFYTSFGEAGGYGTGTGVIDEDGRHSWIGSDFYGLTNTQAQVAADMNTFLYQLSAKYFSIASTSYRANLPHNLIFGPSSMGACTRPQTLQAAGQYLDVVEISAEQSAEMAALPAAYNTAQKPIVLWSTYTSQAASSMTEASQGAPIDQPTQLARGQQYSTYLNALLNIQGSDGSYPIMGVKWWTWTDDVGAQQNYGLVSSKDNAYDGLEDVVAPGINSFGFPIGGEVNNYGNFLGTVTQQNLSVMRTISSAP